MKVLVEIDCKEVLCGSCVHHCWISAGYKCFLFGSALTTSITNQLERCAECLAAQKAAEVRG